MTDEKESLPPDEEEKEALLKKYDVALAQLRLHPTLIWTRNNFFLLTQTGLLAFLANNISKQDTRLGFLVHIGVCLIGLFVAVIWLKVNWAGQTLQRNWREIVRAYEERLFNTKNEDEPTRRSFWQSIKTTACILFGRKPKEIEATSKISYDKSPFLQGILESRTRSVSITSDLINLSRGFVFLWTGLFIVVVWFYICWEVKCR